MARPTDFKEHYVEEAEKLAMLGLTIVEMATVWGTTEQTLCTWQRKNPALAAAIRRGRTGPDAEVAMSLFKRATGYSHPAVKISVTNVEGEVIVTETPYTEHYPPDTAACIFWLKNRRPDLWRDKIDHDVTSNGQTVQAAPLIIAFERSPEQPGDSAKLVGSESTSSGGSGEE